MTNDEKIAAIIALINETADKVVPSDNEDFVAEDYAGGNIDDAFYCGQNDGETQFARTLQYILEQ
jgi:hypothetical protein